MRKRQTIWIAVLLGCALSAAWAQDTSDNPQPQTPQEPVPAYGQDNNGQAPISENPPISGIDLPSLEPHAAPLSYLQPGATVSDTADSNALDVPGGGTQFSSVTRALGSIALQRLWSNYDFAMDYMGGVAYYSLQGQGAKLLQQMDVDQKISWKRGQLALRDSFSYLPEGNFGASYGSLGSANVGSLGNTSFGAFFGGSALGTFGLAPRIINMSLADVTQNLSPKSTLTLAGGYAFTHFYGNDAVLGNSFIGVSQTSAQAGYNRILTSHTQIALIYGYQAFDYSIAGVAFHTHVIEGMYGHRITGRMDFLIGAGPQITPLSTNTVNCSNPVYDNSPTSCTFFGYTRIPVTEKKIRLGVAGQMHLRYRFPKTALDLTYQRFETSGSGFFAGAQSDIARLGATRPISRVWSAFADIGYSHNLRLQSVAASQLSGCGTSGQTENTLCAGINANSYEYGFAGGGVHRQFGHDFNAFVSYQFNEVAFDKSYCGVLSGCGHIANREVITLGLDWTPRPIRLD